jgi:DNA replication protein DnaC
MEQSVRDILKPHMKHYDPDRPVPPPPAPNCGICGDRGWSTDSAMGVVWCECQAPKLAKDAARRLAIFADLPESFQEMTFESFQLRQDLTPPEQVQLSHAVASAREYAKRNVDVKWLVMGGSKGWGKTHLCAAVLNERMAKGQPVKYVSIPDLLTDLKRGFDAGDYNDRLDVYQEVDLLLLDDLGAEYQKSSSNGVSWASDQLYQIVNHRYVHRMDTLITTNVPIRTLDQRIADRVLDRGTGLAKVHIESLPSFRTGRILDES